ncbi:hypothetical protein VTN02DRAFT_1195 [Thermoascus thermophilus]
MRLDFVAGLDSDLDGDLEGRGGPAGDMSLQQKPMPIGRDRAQARQPYRRNGTNGTGRYGTRRDEGRQGCRPRDRGVYAKELVEVA